MQTDLEALLQNMTRTSVDRRSFFQKAGYFGIGAAVSGLALADKPAQAQSNSQQVTDTTAEILTAFLIAEDLATTFYYNGLIGGVIQDPALAGPGGSAKNVTSGGNLGDVEYLRAALYQEFEHAALFRDLLTGTTANSQNDAYQTFYFPAGTFDTLSSFLGILDALENAFIGAYLNMVQEFAYKSSAAISGGLRGGDTKYSAKQYGLFSRIGASILGVECEHRVLGRVIGNSNPANNVAFEQLDGLTAVYTGSKSAVMALTPFLTPSTGPAYSLQTAIKNAGQVWISTGGGLQST